ncbi:MAG: aspartate kinase [Candidatus Bathyarchaeia archaeon]
MSCTRRIGFGRPLVVKFGGSSLADGERISKAVEAVLKELQKGSKMVIVVSAMGKTTDYLLGIVKEVTNNNFSRSGDVDDVLAMGERTSARIFSAALKAAGVESRYFDPATPDWPIITNNKPNNADPILSECEKRINKHVAPLLNEGIIPVLPGFIGKTLQGEITTLGRGGSDITAFIVASSLKAKQVVLVTDVDGIMTADPKLVASAKRIAEIDVNSLIGLASSGSKFIQRKALKYKDPEIDVKIVNHCHCDLGAEGTLIKGFLSSRIVDLEFPEPVASVTIVGNAVSQSPKVLHQIAQTIREADVPLLGVSANMDSIIVYLPEKTLDVILESIHKVVLENSEALSCSVRKNLAFIKIKTAELEETPGIISQFVKALFAKNINVYGIFTVASGIHVFVDVALMEQALTLIRNSVEDFFSLTDLELSMPMGGCVKNV